MVLPEWWVQWVQQEKLGHQVNRGLLVPLVSLVKREDQVKQGKRDHPDQWVPLARLVPLDPLVYLASQAREVFPASQAQQG